MYVCTCIVFLPGLVLIMNMNIGVVNMIIRCDRHSLKAANSLLGVACDDLTLMDYTCTYSHALVPVPVVMSSISGSHNSHNYTFSPLFTSLPLPLLQWWDSVMNSTILHSLPLFTLYKKPLIFRQLPSIYHVEGGPSLTALHRDPLLLLFGPLVIITVGVFQGMILSKFVIIIQLVSPIAST